MVASPDFYAKRVASRSKRGNLHKHGRPGVARFDKNLGAMVETEAVLVHWMVMDDAETRLFGRQPLAVALAIPASTRQARWPDTDSTSDV